MICIQSPRIYDGWSSVPTLIYEYAFMNRCLLWTEKVRSVFLQTDHPEGGQYREENGMLALRSGLTRGSADITALRCGVPGCTDHPGSWRTENRVALGKNLKQKEENNRRRASCLINWKIF